MIPNDEWYTPDYVIDCVDKLMPEWFDPCPAGWGKLFDGLTGAWEYDCFINPPYSPKLKKAFIEKAIDEFYPSDCRFLWLVNYANSKDCKILSEKASAVCIPYKRVSFIPGHESLKAGSPRYDNIFYLWGRSKGFAEAFKSIGRVYAQAPA